MFKSYQVLHTQHRVRTTQSSYNTEFVSEFAQDQVDENLQVQKLLTTSYSLNKTCTKSLEKTIQSYSEDNMYRITIWISSELVDDVCDRPISSVDLIDLVDTLVDSQPCSYHLASVQARVYQHLMVYFILISTNVSSSLSNTVSVVLEHRMFNIHCFN